MGLLCGGDGAFLESFKPFKKPRKSQEVDTESVYYSGL